MRKKHIILIIVSMLIILSVTIFFTIKNIRENDLGDMSWIDEKPLEEDKELIFNDVPKNHWASGYIDFLSKREIMIASGDGNFYPDEKVTIEEFIEILALINFNGINSDNSSGDSFTRSLEILKTNGVLSQEQFNENNRFENIKKIDVAVLVAKADLKIKVNKQKIIDLAFTDLQEIDEVEMSLLVHSVASGFFINETSKFYPNNSITRAEVAKVLYYFLNK